MDVKQILEASLFSSEEPIKLSDIAREFNISTKDLYRALRSLKKDYDERNSAIEIVKIGQKYVMQLREEFLEIGYRFGKPELDRDVIKTLAIIAYYQPIKQSDLREMLGEKIYEHVDLLRKKKLVNLKKEDRTFVLTVTKNFSTYFGIDAKNPQEIREYLSKKLNLNLGDGK